MKKTSTSMLKWIYLSMLFSLFACSEQPVKTQQAFDFSNTGEIGLRIQADDYANLDIATLTTTVSKNLQDWDYPIASDNSQTTSHQLVAKVGAITYGSTPTGFSYSAGNSDPRSLEFQKMDVLPINCQLQSNEHLNQASELSMDFMADKTDKEFLDSAQLADHISTVCFNLLTEVKWPLKTQNQEGSKTLKSPGWIPEVRIEEKLTTDDPVKTDFNKPSSFKQESVESPTNQQPKTAIKNTPKRRIIIHNQGAPVIFEFGYERR
jgi:hypothetical protein